MRSVRGHEPGAPRRSNRSTSSAAAVGGQTPNHLEIAFQSQASGRHQPRTYGRRCSSSDRAVREDPSRSCASPRITRERLSLWCLRQPDVPVLCSGSFRNRECAGGPDDPGQIHGEREEGRAPRPRATHQQDISVGVFGTELSAAMYNGCCHLSNLHAAAGKLRRRGPGRRTSSSRRTPLVCRIDRPVCQRQHEAFALAGESPRRATRRRTLSFSSTVWVLLTSIAARLMPW